MYASFSRLLGLISVKETDSHIIVNGLPGLRFSRDVYNHWKTSKINNNMFTSISRNQVKFPKFFAIEVLYMLEALIQSRRTFVGRRVLMRVVEELYHSTWLCNIGVAGFTPRINYKALDDLTVTLFPHQSKFLQEYDRTTFEYSLKGMLMDVAAGGGKTILNYALGHTLGADTKVFVVPKNSVMDVWVKTINMLFKQTPTHWFSLSGHEPVLGKEYYIVHFDYLEKFLTFVSANKGSFGSVFVGIDESHNFNEQSNRTQRLIDLCQVLKAKDVVHASGTPFKAMGSEAITLLSTICDDFTGDAQQAFRKIFGKEAKRANEILANRIGIVSFKVPKQDIETPGVDYHETKVAIKNGADYTLTSVRDKMSKFIEERMMFYRKGMPEYEKLYATCMDLHERTLNSAGMQQFRQYQGYVKQLRKGYDAATMKDLVMFCNRYELKNITPSLPDKFRKPFLNVRAVIKYVDLKVMGEALSQVLGRMRIQCHLDMLPHMPLDDIIDNATSKTVIFTSYVEVVKELDNLLKAAGYKPLLVYGETNKDLPAIVKQFANDEDINPLVATFKSLSTAVPLTMANSVVFTNSPFRDYERIQTIARVDRIGQPYRSHVHEIFLDTGGEGNISTRSKDIMQWSKEQVESILGVTAPADLEASLESLVENPNATLVDAGVFFGELNKMLPIDTIPEEEDVVSMEGFFGNNTPKVDIAKGYETKEIFKQTYLNDGWLDKQTLRTGEFNHDNGSYLERRAVDQITSELGEFRQVSDRVLKLISPIARAFASGGWKDPVKVEAWHKLIRKDTVETTRAVKTVNVIVDFPELPTIKPLIPKKTNVSYLSSKQDVKHAAEALVKFISLDGLGLVDEFVLDAYTTIGKEFDPYGEGKLLHALDNTGVSHVQKAVDIYNAIQDSFDKLGTDLANSKSYHTLINQHSLVAKALLLQLSKSIK